MAWVKFVREDIEIEVEDGISVLEAEIQAGLRPDAPCGGRRADRGRPCGSRRNCMDHKELL